MGLCQDLEYREKFSEPSGKVSSVHYCYWRHYWEVFFECKPSNFNIRILLKVTIFVNSYRITLPQTELLKIANIYDLRASNGQESGGSWAGRSDSGSHDVIGMEEELQSCEGPMGVQQPGWACRLLFAGGLHSVVGLKTAQPTQSPYLPPVTAPRDPSAALSLSHSEF